MAEDEGNALKNEHGQRHIRAALQAAEWERGTRMVDAWCPRRVWLPPSPFTAAFGGRCDFTYSTQCVGSAERSPIYAEETVLCETCDLDANTKLRVWCGCGRQETSAMCEVERELAPCAFLGRGIMLGMVDGPHDIMEWRSIAAPF